MSVVLVKPFQRYDNSYTNNFVYKLCNNSCGYSCPINYYDYINTKNINYNCSCMCEIDASNSSCGDTTQSIYYRENTLCIPEVDKININQKIIQNTVRVPSSLYTMNLAGLNVYQNADNSLRPNGVNWNQMSDRPIASVQKTYVPSSRGNSHRSSSAVKGYPGALSPGGKGCDIKHNSYDRYLNRLKGKSALREGNPYSNAKYGGKSFNMNIVSGCNCNLIV